MHNNNTRDACNVVYQRVISAVAWNCEEVNGGGGVRQGVWEFIYLYYLEI